MPEALHLFSIIGPTATGKTEVALAAATRLIDLGKVSRVDIVAADSRQVYQGLEILTGADVPENFHSYQDSGLNYPFFANDADTIRIHGQSCLSPRDEWSVAHFQELGKEVLTSAVKTNSVVLVVGGTGLYHHHLLNQDRTLHIPPNPLLRQTLQQLNILELQQKLQDVNLAAWEKMNHSDRSNPRRLVRAIEIAEYGLSTKRLEIANVKENRENISLLENLPLSHTYIGLSASLDFLQHRIAQRVQARWSGGAIEEITKLSESIPADSAIWTATGAKEIRSYLNHECDASTAQRLWSLHEFQYAKRQLTWWKKKTEVEWIDREQPNWLNSSVGTIISLMTSLN